MGREASSCSVSYMCITNKTDKASGGGMVRITCTYEPGVGAREVDQAATLGLIPSDAAVWYTSK